MFVSPFGYNTGGFGSSANSGNEAGAGADNKSKLTAQNLPAKQELLAMQKLDSQPFFGEGENPRVALNAIARPNPHMFTDNQNQTTKQFMAGGSEGENKEQLQNISQQNQQIISYLQQLQQQRIRV